MLGILLRLNNIGKGIHLFSLILSLYCLEFECSGFNLKKTEFPTRENSFFSDKIYNTNLSWEIPKFAAQETDAQIHTSRNERIPWKYQFKTLCAVQS